MEELHGECNTTDGNCVCDRHFKGEKCDIVLNVWEPMVSPTKGNGMEWIIHSLSRISSSNPHLLLLLLLLLLMLLLRFAVVWEFEQAPGSLKVYSFETTGNPCIVWWLRVQKVCPLPWRHSPLLASALLYSPIHHHSSSCILIHHHSSSFLFISQMSNPAHLLV